MKFTSKFFIEFYIALKGVFSKEWPEGTAPISDHQIWKLLGGESVNKYKVLNDSVVRQLFNVSDRYFYQQYNTAMKDNKLIIIRDDIAIKVFRYIGCVGKNPLALLDDFLKLKSIPEDISNSQRNLNEKNAKLLNVQFPNHPPKSQDDLLQSLRGISEKCHLYLTGTRWWVYFYGYESVNENDYQGNEWMLIRLLLTFENDGKYNLSVFIENVTDFPDYSSYDYRGSTEFSDSSYTVLSMKLYSQPGAIRLLVINVNIGKGSGNLFMGQYLNYDEAGYITSGTVILEKIDTSRYSAPKSTLFFIPRKALLPDDYPSEVRHIAYLLQDRHLNFRRSPIGIHSAADLEKWQDQRRQSKSK